VNDTIIIRLGQPRKCCRLIAIRRRCGEMATMAQATRLADGSYHPQPYCDACLKALGLAAPAAPKEQTDE